MDLVPGDLPSGSRISSKPSTSLRAKLPVNWLLHRDPMRPMKVPWGPMGEMVQRVHICGVVVQQALANYSYKIRFQLKARDRMELRFHAVSDDCDFPVLFQTMQKLTDAFGIFYLEVGNR